MEETVSPENVWNGIPKVDKRPSEVRLSNHWVMKALLFVFQDIWTGTFQSTCLGKNAQGKAPASTQLTTSMTNLVFLGLEAKSHLAKLVIHDLFPDFFFHFEVKE